MGEPIQIIWNYEPNGNVDYIAQHGVTEEEATDLILSDVAERSGIDKSRLSKLENDPRANPTLTTLTRIANAIGVRLEIHVA